MRLALLLPWPDPGLSPNSPRRSWQSKIRLRNQAKYDAKMITLEAVSTVLPRDYPIEYASNETPFTGDLELYLKFYPPDQVRRDLDNLLASLKPALDGVCQGLDIDDAQFTRIVLERGVVHRPGEVIVEIRRMA